jgi:hypothetical protein
MTRGFPQSQEAPSNSRAVAPGFFCQMTSRFPSKPGGASFPSPRWLRAFFSPHGSGFPLRQLTQSFPFAGWLGGFPPCRVAPGSSLASGLEITHCRGGSGFPPRRVAQSFLFAGDAGLLLARRPGFALCRVARGFPLTVARGFPFAGYRPGGRRISTPIGGTAQGVSGSNFKIL